MTSEVCLMNRLGVVLAADSASTVSYWNGDNMEERYFKGANKIFQLSERHPIGIMIYDGADLLGVPWELVIKDFRKYLAARSFANVQGYADELISYINNNVHFFPPDIRSEHFMAMAKQVLFGIVYGLRKAAAPGATITPDQLMAELEDVSKSTFAGADRLDGLQQIYSKQVRGAVADFADHLLNITGFVASDAAVRGALSKTLDHLKGEDAPATGLVLVGFGDNSVFPEQLHLVGCRFWDQEFQEDRRDSAATSHETPAVISGFAQTSMTDTFMIGFSLDVWMAVTDALAIGIDSAVKELANNHGLQLSPADQSDLTTRTTIDIRKSVVDHAQKNHGQPLRRVVGSMAVDEMADLAETLINLQSLKEKVTRPSETVGGPVDVAVITRTEGLVWIKRKHYFKPDINSRFFERRVQA